MSKPLAIHEAQELLDSLKRTVREFAEREAKLNQEHRQKAELLQRGYRAKREEEEAQLAVALQEAEATAQAARERVQMLYAQRKERIRKARRPSQAQTLARIDEHEGRRKGQLQKNERDATRAREQGLAAAEAAYADFTRSLAEVRESIEALEVAATKSFRGYPRLSRLMREAGAMPAPDLAPDEHKLLEELRRLLPQTTGDLRDFGRQVLPRLFRFVPLWLQVLLLAGASGALIPLLQARGLEGFSYPHAGGVFAVLLSLALFLFLAGQRKAKAPANKVGQALEKARRIHNACLEKAQHRRTHDSERLEAEFKSTSEAINREWHAAVTEAAEMREYWPNRIEEKHALVNQHHERLHKTRCERLERAHADEVARIQQAADARMRLLTQNHEEAMRRLDADHGARWQEMGEEWRSRLEPIYDTIQAENAFAAKESLPWRPELWENWRPPPASRNAVSFGKLELDVPKFAEAAPQDKRLALPGPAEVSLPLWLVYPRQGSILFESKGAGGEQVAAAMNNIIFRLLSISPPGKVSFTLIDPVKLGQSFSGIMHLADFEDNLINNRIWTQTTQIEQRLNDLTEHMEKVIQMYLRNEYETIADYNIEAGNIAEKYHFVVIADFPSNFSDIAARRLLHIASAGARCGVFTLIHWDHRYQAPADLLPEVLRQSSVCITHVGGALQLGKYGGRGARLVLEAAPEPEFGTRFLQQVGEISRGSNRVEVPFNQVTPAESERWTLETTDELRVPIGRSGATKLQYLTVGKGTRQHALVAGKTGSGKSTLFHVIISNLALWCSPEQVEFYLVDFKKGVEFKCYGAHRLPHARVVAIESDREFGLSVLHRVDEELRRRGDLFRKLGVQDVAGYKRAGGTESMPRSLLLIDEFQEFFVEDDRISQAAAVLLDRIVRQGRAFGIHVILGSQTLGGAYTLARTTMGQMVIRIALQCNEADAYLIMDENNSAPRLLSRPGEGIYNDTAGTLEGNSPFQTVWLSDEERDQALETARRLADERAPGYAGPVVFEGNAPADVRDNPLLRGLLEAESVKPPAAPRFWLGSPNSIKAPTDAVFHRRSGSNLLIVGQRDEAVLAMLASGLISISAQYAKGGVRFVLFDAAPPGTPPREFIDRVTAVIPHEITLAKSGDVSDVMARLGEDMKARAENEHAAAPETFLFIHGLQNFKKFRQEDDFSFSMDDSEKGANPAALLSKIITEGASLGIHVIATIDTYNNVNRFLGRKGLTEFEMRVLFQMSTNDSASLCDDPQASTLGLHCALYYNEQEGYLEKFRPYALPSSEWIAGAGRNLARLVK